MPSSLCRLKIIRFYSLVYHMTLAKASFGKPITDYFCGLLGCSGGASSCTLCVRAPPPREECASRSLFRSTVRRVEQCTCLFGLTVLALVLESQIWGFFWLVRR